MSYCRWSSDDYQCDVYVYDDVGGGWTTHVAGMRYVFSEPLPPKIEWSKDNAKACVERMVKVGRIAESSELVPIGLPFDGEHFNDSTAKECAKRLRSLREAGYLVPQYAIDALENEEPESD